MLQLIKRLIFHSLILMTFLVHVFQSFAQRPPTGGAAPLNEKDDSSINPIVFVIGGAVVIGAASVLIVKSKGPKIPVAEHLPSYLLAHNILPNEDALELMYEINTSLKDVPEIRSKKKLDMPEFPELNQSLASNLPGKAQVTASSQLMNQISVFKNGKENFNDLTNENSSPQIQAGLQKVNSFINQMERSLSSFDFEKQRNASVNNELVFDLLDVFNQTLDRIIEAKAISLEQENLLQSITDSMEELISNITTFSQLQEEIQKIGSLDKPSKNTLTASRLDKNGAFPVVVSDDPNPSITQSYLTVAGNTLNFALAVYKYSEEGELITEGPEVEGKYLIRYVLPALKDYENAYHTIRNPATYAIGAFPPAKIYMAVEDEDGNKVEIQHPVVDFKVAFDSRQLVNENNMIVVPLKIKP